MEAQQKSVSQHVRSQQHLTHMGELTPDQQTAVSFRLFEEHVELETLLHKLEARMNVTPLPVHGFNTALPTDKSCVKLYAAVHNRLWWVTGKCTMLHKLEARMNVGPLQMHGFCTALPTDRSCMLLYTTDFGGSQASVYSWAAGNAHESQSLAYM